MSTWIWVLSFTVLGAVPKHGELAKYGTKAECEQALTGLKQEAQRQNQQLTGRCFLMIKQK